MNLEGIILKTFDQGEADLAVALLTYESGKVFVKARGAKKMAAKLGPHLQPLNKVLIHTVPPARTTQPIIIDVEALDGFNKLRRSPRRFIEALAGLGLVDVFTHGGEAGPGVFTALADFLGTLESAAMPAARGALERLTFAVLKESGLTPQVNKCLKCRARIAGRAFLSIALGGLLCGRCQPLTRSGLKPLSAEMVALLQNLGDNRRRAKVRLSDRQVKLIRPIAQVFSEYVAPQPLYAFQFLNVFQFNIDSQMSDIYNSKL